MKEFREFIALWIETGFDWHGQNPEWVTGWKFGHDMTNDWCTKATKDFPADLTRKPMNVLCEVIPILVVTKQNLDSSTTVLLNWLRQHSLTAPPKIEDFIVKQFAYTVYQLLK